MIAILKGKIKLKEDEYVVLDVLGIGFKVFCSKKVIADLPLEKEIELFIYFYKTQTTSDLYGFVKKEEKEFFEKLVNLPSIGPKAALAILSTGQIEKIKEAIGAGNEKYFEKIPGVGQKRIKKMILELSGKISQEVKKPVSQEDIKETKQEDKEIIEALINLGISKQKAKAALDMVPKEIEGAENIIREALKLLGK